MSTLPDISLQKDENTNTYNSAYASPNNEEVLNQNKMRLIKIRNSVRSVERIGVVQRKRLYQGIVVISKKEFYIDIFMTKTKFYISAIELTNKTPHMIELYIPQAKNLLKE
mmetsp:Transcript_17971/g.15889  ORF Transcript_17971/g.15889 Transcript_17971/m.15889 type:complete len:111 (+) Transcript_17971:556-888(+)